MRMIRLLSTVALLSLTFYGCKKSSNPQTVYYGDATAIGSGSMKSWIKTDGNGKPVSVGVTFSATALSSLPASDSTYMLMLPGMSGGMNMTMPAPFDHIEIDWSAHGDTGTQIFDHPHLDCHFFTVSSSSQMGIMGGMDTIMLGANYIPHNCMGDGSVEPMMGQHYYDTTLSVYHGTSFSQTYMYGFYEGNMTFVEIMCAKSYLDTNPNYSGSIDQPQTFKTHGYYPMNYSLSYNAGTKEYTYSLDNLVYH